MIPSRCPVSIIWLDAGCVALEPGACLPLVVRFLLGSSEMVKLSLTTSCGQFRRCTVGIWFCLYLCCIKGSDWARLIETISESICWALCKWQALISVFFLVGDPVLSKGVQFVVKVEWAHMPMKAQSQCWCPPSVSTLFFFLRLDLSSDSDLTNHLVFWVSKTLGSSCLHLPVLELQPRYSATGVL